MDVTDPPTTLRSRLIANTASPDASRTHPGWTIGDDDPFAGEDALWAPEDWSDPPYQDELGERFFFGVFVAIGLSAVGWFMIAGAAVLAYRLLT